MELSQEQCRNVLMITLQTLYGVLKPLEIFPTSASADRVRPSKHCCFVCEFSFMYCKSDCVCTSDHVWTHHMLTSCYLVVGNISFHCHKRCCSLISITILMLVSYIPSQLRWHFYTRCWSESFLLLSNLSREAVINFSTAEVGFLLFFLITSTMQCIKEQQLQYKLFSSHCRAFRYWFAKIVVVSELVI